MVSLKKLVLEDTIYNIIRDTKVLPTYDAESVRYK